MFKKLILTFVFLILLACPVFGAYLLEEHEIIDEDSSFFNITTNNASYYFTSTQQGFNIQKLYGTVIVSYQGQGIGNFWNTNTHNVIAVRFPTSATWNVQVLDNASANQPLCFLYKDDDDDVVCLYYWSDNMLRYRYMPEYENEARYFYTNETTYQSAYGTFSELPLLQSDIGDTHKVIDIKTYQDKINIITRSIFHDNLVKYIISDLSQLYYFTGYSDLGNATYGMPQSFYKGLSYFRFGYQENKTHFITIMQDSTPDKEHYRYANIDYINWSMAEEIYSGMTMDFNFLIYNSSNIITFELYPSAVIELRWRIRNETGWSSRTTVSLVDGIYNYQLKLIAGNQYIWGVYISDSDNNLRLFKLNKSDLSLVSDTAITISGDVKTLGSIYGSKTYNQGATLALEGNDLSVIYTETNSTNHDKVIYFNYNTSDAFTGSIECSTNFDCWQMYGVWSYICVDGRCVLPEEVEDVYEEGDWVYDFNNWLRSVGIVSSTSKWLLGLFLIVITSGGVAFLTKNVLLSTATGLLVMCMVVFLNLIPIWSIALGLLFLFGLMFVWSRQLADG